MSVKCRQSWTNGSALYDSLCHVMRSDVMQLCVDSGSPRALDFVPRRWTASAAATIAMVMIASILSGCVTATAPAPVSVARGATIVVTEYVNRSSSASASNSQRALRWLGDADDGEYIEDYVSHDALSDPPVRDNRVPEQTGTGIYSIERSAKSSNGQVTHSESPTTRHEAVGIYDSGQSSVTTPARGNAQLLPVISALSEFENSWTGVRYRWGGNGRSGIDCSALVGRAFRKLFDIQLPRTTREQVVVGSKVKRARLLPGDLVFFRLARGRRHVGVYLGNSRFLHASRSRGVAVSSLSGRYWSRHYWTARRVLDLPQLALTGN